MPNNQDLRHSRCYNFFFKLWLMFSRNINTVRAITKEHGSLVDRYTLMARSATRGFFIVPDASLMQQFQGVWQQVIFDWRLWYVCHPPLWYAVVNLKNVFMCVFTIGLMVFK